MEGSCSTGQSPQRAVVPVEEEEEEKKFLIHISLRYRAMKFMLLGKRY
jgi:hypothetical protein